jgi:hypothetical protein
VNDTFGSNIARDVIAHDAYGSIYSAQYQEAAKSARANEIGRRLGLPPDIVEANMPDMMAQDRVQRAIAQARKNAAYARMMANPRLAAAGIDDHHLPAVAKAVGEHVDFSDIKRRAGGGLWGDLAAIGAGTGVLATRVGTGFLDLLSSASGLAHAATEIADRNHVTLSPVDPFLGGMSMALRLFGNAHQAIRKAADASRVDTSNRNFNDVASGVEGIPTALAALAATGAGGPGAGAAVFGGQGFSDAYDEGRDAGLNPNRAALYGVGDAAIQAGTMFLPEKYLGGVLSGKGGAGKALASGVGLSEVATALQGLNHWYFIDKPKGVTFDQFVQSLPDQMRSTLVSTLTTMGVTIGAGHVASKVMNNVADARGHESLDSVMDAAAKSSTRTSNPSDFEAALNQLVGDSDASDIYVPADKVLELFQPQEGKAQRDLRSDPFWGQYAGQIEEAGTLGGDVVVPLSAAATHLAGSQDWSAIRDFVRTRPGGASRAELNTEADPKELEALASDIARKLDEAAPHLKATALTRDFAAKLGYKGEQADAISQLLGAGLARAYALETARQEAAGRPVESLEDFAASWLPEAQKTTQAAFDAARAANEGVTAEAAQTGRTDSLAKTASWVIREKGTGKVIMETFDPKQVEALNTNKYEAVPIQEYLGSINGKGGDTLSDTQRRGNISIARDAEGLMTGAVIRAFEASDFSTAIHETGHFFLEDLKRRALGEGATEQEKADWQAVKDWLGTSDDSIPTESHEQFARGFERYIYEGNAPAKGLKAVFAKMRDFMVSLYRSVRSFNSPITPEIRSVMDRLLASDDEINARREELRLGDQALSELMSGEEQQRYALLGEEARSEARDRLYDKVLSTIRAERTRTVARRKNEIRQEIGDQTDAQPIFRALKMLRSGRAVDGETTRVTIPRQWLVDNYGEDVLAKLPKGVPPIVDDAHGVDPESLAQEAGFDNADQMVQKLISHEEARQALKANGDNRSPRRALVENMTEERLRAELGDPFANLEEEADAALANERQADRLSLELRALSRKTGKQPVPWKLAKDWARAHVRADTVRDASKSVQQYARIASKAAQAVEEALVSGDYEAAFRAKQQQVLNLALMSEAKAAKDETVAAAKRLRKIAKAANIPSVDQDYLDQAHRLLENVDMKSRPEKAVDRRMAFEAWHAKQVEQEIDPVVPPEYQSILGQTHWTRLSVNDLLDLDKAVKQIVKLGRLKQELKDGQKTRDFNEAVTEMQDRGGQVPPRKTRGKTTDPRKSPIGRAASRLRSIDAAMLKAEQICIWLDNHDPNGPWQRYLYRPFAEAQGRKSDLTRQYGRELNALIRAMPKAAVRALTRSVDTPELVIRNSNHLSNGQAWKGTKDQVLMMALNWGNLGNRQRLLDGFGWREEDVARVFDRTLTKDDWDFVQGVWDTVDKLWPDVAKLEREVNGVEPEKVEAAEVPTPHGTYRGGYFPIVYDPMQTTHTAQVAEDKMAPSGGWWSITTRSSATKERAEQVKGRPLDLSLSVITHHMNEVIHDLTHRQAVGQAKRLLANERVMATMNSRMGPEYLDATRRWVENIAKPNAAYSRANPAVVWLARYLNKAITTVGLGFRVTVSLKQLMGIPFSAKELGSDNLAKGMAIVLSNPVAAYREMTERSAEMRARSDHLDASIEDMHHDMSSGKLKTIGPRGITKYAFQGIAYMDVVSRTTVWTSAYNKGIAEGMSEADAVAYGDRSVRQSHGIGFQKDRAAIQYDHPFARALWPFFSYMNALYNAQRDVGHRVARAETARDYGEAARRAWWVMAVPGLLSATLFEDGPSDDTVGGWLKYLTEQTMLSNFESLPLVGNFTTAMGRGYGYRAISYQQIGDSIKKAVQEDKRIFQGDADVSGASIKHTMEAVGTLFAKPLGQIGATAGGLYDYETGKADPQSVGDWYYLLTRGSIPQTPTAAERIAGRKQ